MTTLIPSCVTRDITRESRVTWGVTFAVSHGTPTRPDPTRVKTSTYVGIASLGKYRAREADDAMRGASR